MMQVCQNLRLGLRHTVCLLVIHCHAVREMFCQAELYKSSQSHTQQAAVNRTCCMQ